MDFRRVFLTYLEAPNSILAKNQKIGRILLNLPIFPLSPCLGSLGLLSFCRENKPSGTPSRHLYRGPSSFNKASVGYVCRIIMLIYNGVASKLDPLRNIGRQLRSSFFVVFLCVVVCVLVVC